MADICTQGVDTGFVGLGYAKVAFLGLVQGITELLPISSTAHMRIVPAVLGWQDPGSAFSAVVMADVIEHLIDPGAALRRCRELLAPGGKLALVLPDSGSALARAMGRRWWSVIPTHVQYFTRASLARLLDREGYDLLAVATSPKAFTVRYYLGRLGGYSEGLAATAIAVAERAGFGDRIWAPDFGDRMIVVARPR